MNVSTDLVGLIIFVYFVVRHVTPRSPSRVRFYILPIVALVVAYENLPRPAVPPGQLWEALVSVGLCLPFGVMQAYFTTLYQSDRRWLIRGDWRYLASWAALLVLHVATTLLFDPAAHGTAAIITWIIALDVAVTWALRSLILHLRYPELGSILTASEARS